MTDTIDRDELLRELTKRRAEKEHGRNLGSGFYKQGYLGGFDDAVKIVDSVRAADVETVRRGTWIEEETLWDDRYWTCSVCHESRACRSTVGTVHGAGQDCEGDERA